MTLTEKIEAILASDDIRQSVPFRPDYSKAIVALAEAIVALQPPVAPDVVAD